MSSSEKSRCTDIAPLLVFYACDEVTGAERERIEQHLQFCKLCADQLAGDSALWEMLGAGNASSVEIQSTDALLAQCRSELAEKLDDLASPPVQEHWQPFGWVRRWMALRPALSGAALVFFGILLGAQVMPWLQQAGLPGNANSQSVNVLASPKLTDEQLSKMAVAGVNLAPWPNAEPGTVQLQLRAEQPMVLSGNVDDSNMRRVLTYVVENGDRFDAGVRLDCLDALKAQARDQQVRRALIAAARKDQNPAVRMRALESLRDAVSDVAVRDALVDALQHDSNPGVRVEVVNMLVRSVERERGEQDASLPAIPSIPAMPSFPATSAVPAIPALPAVVPDEPSEMTSEDSAYLNSDASVERVIRTLQELQKRDPSKYVRLRSAAALRQIGPRELQ